MTTSINNFSGLSSGVQWNDLVDATISAMEARNVTPITDRITLQTKQQEAWKKLQGLVQDMNSAALAVRKVGFGGYSATVPTSASSGRSLLTATASNAATAGRYRVEVQQVADTAKIGGGAVSDTTAARGLDGTFSVNGTAITVDAADSLAGIRDKINAANAGVSATIVSEGGTAGRLVITSKTSGSTGLNLTDGTNGIARELGFVDTRSKPISSATAAAAVALGMSVYPQPASIRVGDKVIVADLANESISRIASKINAAGGSASVESEVYGDETRYRLVVDGNVSAVSGDPDSQAVVDALGFAAGKTGAIAQSVQSAAFTDSSDGVVNAASSLAGLKVDGSSVNLNVGDAINIRGTRGDGTAVTYGLVVQPGDTMQTLLDRINDASSGFGSGARTANAQLGDDGRIRLTDETGGASRLALSMTVTRADGSTGTLGATTTAVAGRSRQLQEGRDAIFRVDGQEFTRSTNTIADAVPGLTLNLLTAEPGSTVDVAVDRDVQANVDATKKLVDAYNAIRSFYDEQRATDAPLYSDSSLRRVVNTMTDALRTEVASNGTYSRSVNVGLMLDRNGKLAFDQDAFKKALADKPEEVEALFGLTGLGTAFVKATDNATSFGAGPISTQMNSLSESMEKLRGREIEEKKRLELRREQLILRYTQMEEAMTRLTSQSNSLLSSVQGLQGNSR
jgi:flagellar hook-associated protein 2